MNAFLTGSRRYGIPKHDADVDIVIRCKQDVVDALLMIGETVEDMGNSYGNITIEIGFLHLICCLDDATYAEWMLGTECLSLTKPITRDDAKELFKEIRKHQHKATGGK